MIKTEYVVNTEYVYPPEEFLVTQDIPVLKGKTTGDLITVWLETETKLKKSNEYMQSLILWKDKINNDNKEILETK